MERIDEAGSIVVNDPIPKDVDILAIEYREILKNELRIVETDLEQAKKCIMVDDLIDLDLEIYN